MPDETKCSHRIPGQPSGYVARAEWAEKKLVTHRQEQCPVCGLWVFWVKREKRDA